MHWCCAIQKSSNNPSCVPLREMFMAPQVQIKRAVPDDICGAKQVQEAVLSENHKYQYFNNIKNSGCCNFVAVISGEIVGYISSITNVCNSNGPCLWERLAPYVAFVGVLPSFQKQGICRSLVQSLVHQLHAETDSKYLYLECVQEVSEIYEKFGFTILGANYVEQTWGLLPKGIVMRLNMNGLQGKGARVNICLKQKFTLAPFNSQRRAQ